MKLLKAQVNCGLESFFCFPRFRISQPEFSYMMGLMKGVSKLIPPYQNDTFLRLFETDEIG